MVRGKNKIVKKAIAYLLVFALCVPLLGVAAQKKTAEAAFVSSDGQWYYNLKADGTATITGIGSKGGSNVVIPTTVDGLLVTSIGNIAFSDCESLSKVTIPGSVTSIGDDAFYGCMNLIEVIISDGVTSIGDAVFCGCESLSKVTIPDSVTSIGVSVFFRCKSLREVIIPDGVISIGKNAFSDCESLSKVTIPDSVTSIGGFAFSGCESLNKVTIPNSVTSIGSFAFRDCKSLSEVIIPNSVISIDDFAFSGCESFNKITIPNSVTSIGIDAFSGCKSLSEVIILNGVTNIGGFAFRDCENLRKVTIPNSVTSIGNAAFISCKSLSEVTIPNSVTNIGGFAFYDCSASLVIYTTSGSYAETYANNNGITVKTDTTVNPVVTPTPPPMPPTPTPTSMPTPVCVSPLPPTPTPTVTPTPTPELQVSANITELTADTQGNFLDNRVDVSLTNTYECSVSTGSSSWLKVCNKNASASASTNIWLYNSEKEGTCSFYVFADENTSIAPRKGEITITASDWDKTVKTVVEVTQGAGKAVLEVSATEITANSKGKTNISSVKVTTNKTGGFSVNNDGNSWIKLGSSSYESSPKAKVSFETGGTFYVFVSENPSDEERTGRIIVTHEDGETKEVIEVRQDGAGASLSVDSTSKMADNSGTFYNNAVYVDTSDTGSFTATVEGASWLKVSTESFASFADGMTSITLGGNAYIYLVADKNTGAERTATIKITHEGGKVSKTVTVTQLGKAASYLEVDRESAYFDEPTRAVDGMIHISADENTKWTVTSSKSWIKILKEDWLYAEEYASIEGTGSGGFYILVKENDTYKDRDGYVTISAPGLESHTIYVHQAENEIRLEDLLKEVSISVTKKTFNKGKTTKIKLNYPEGLYASDIKSVKFSSSKKKVATVNSKGVVKGIKKGKAVISVKVTLDNKARSSKTFKAKITVDKRKVKLAKFK